MDAAALSRRWFLAAVTYFVIGIGLGVYMGASGDHSLFPVHAHINLLGWVSMALIGLLGGKDVLVGAIDVATDRVETPAEVAAVIREAMTHVKASQVFPCTNCGMVPLAREVAVGKLRSLAAGAALVRKELGGS